MEKRNNQVASFVRQKLQTMKLRRILKSFRSFTQWNKYWIENVQKNFQKQKMKMIFRDLYLNAVLNKFQQRRTLRFKSKVMFQIQNHGKQEIQLIQDLNEQFQKSNN